MTDFLYVSPHRLGKAIEQAKELAALAKKLGGTVEITVRPVAEIDALKQQVATLAEALRWYADADKFALHSSEHPQDRARAALKAAGVEP